MQPPKLDFEALTKALSESDARIVLVGGFAMIAHGADTDTRDIDFAFARDKQSVHAIVEALKPFDPRPRDFPEDVPFVWDDQTLNGASLLTLQTSVGKIDLLGEIAGIASFTELYAESTPIKLFGRPIRVASLRHLIAMKEAAGRDKDLMHIALLKELVNGPK